MSFWCHHFDQKANKNIVRISALGLPGSFLGIPVGFLTLLTKSPGSPKKLPGCPQEATKNLGKKSLQYLCCYFGQNNQEDISKLYN